MWNYMFVTVQITVYIFHFVNILPHALGILFYI